MAGDGALLAAGSLVTALAAIGILLSARSAPLHREIAPVLSSAFLEAAMRDQVYITIEHLALALSFDPNVERRMRNDGLDVEGFRERLEVRLGPLVHTQFANDKLPVSPLRDAVAERVLGTARGARAAPTPIRVYSALIASREAPLRAFADEMRNASTKSAAASPDADSPYRSPPAHPVAQLRIWNDARSSMPFVITSLIEHCGLTPAHARYVMWRTHFVGSAVALETSTMDEARAVADRIMRVARGQSFPLRVTVEPAGAAAPGWLARSSRRQR
jgi:ATP-dependent Clp protease adapter protein ClpS